jgi:hypothetical protein
MVPFGTSRPEGVKNFGLTELVLSVIPQYVAVRLSSVRCYEANLSFSAHGLQARDEIFVEYPHTSRYPIKSAIISTKTPKLRELLVCARAYSDAGDHRHSSHVSGAFWA